MLAERDRERILLEEKYRHEIAKKLEESEPKDIRSRIFGFLNSAFGIWLLSTLVVGAASWIYTSWHDYRVERQTSRESIENLDREIISRVRAIAFLSQQSHIDEKSQMMMAMSLSSSVTGIAMPLLGDANISPQYKGRSLSSLVWELRSAVPDPEKQPLDAVMADVEQLNFSASGVSASLFNGDDKSSPDSLLQINAAVRGILICTRWESAFADLIKEGATNEVSEEKVRRLEKLFEITIKQLPNGSGSVYQLTNHSGKEIKAIRWAVSGANAFGEPLEITSGESIADIPNGGTIDLERIPLEPYDSISFRPSAIVYADGTKE